ncbi:hypothetical protein [Yersinia aleksiciae]|uniref:hypothetical protein n=1 Tax=Yersinia aleksiciae TaxID=263819 RepID=UPI0011A0A429|nr:hypothetical protein [Yersinia aleksiciae]
MKKIILSMTALIASSPLFVSAAEGVSNTVDLTPLTNGVNFTGVQTAVMTIAGGLIVVYLAIAGTKTILRMVKSS